MRKARGDDLKHISQRSVLGPTLYLVHTTNLNISLIGRYSCSLLTVIPTRIIQVLQGHLPELKAAIQSEEFGSTARTAQGIYRCYMGQ